MAAAIADTFIDSRTDDSYMPEEVLFKAKTHAGREAIASILGNKAKKLEKGETIVIAAGADALEMADDPKQMSAKPPVDTAFEITFAREAASEGPRRMSLEFKLTWDESGGGGDDGSVRSVEAFSQ